MKRAPHGHTLIELMIVLLVAAPVLTAVTSIVTRHEHAAAPNERRADDMDAFGRILQRLTSELRNAVRVDACAAGLDIETRLGTTRWRVTSGVLRVSGRFRCRVRGCEALGLRREGRLLHVRLLRKGAPAFVVTVCPRRIES